MTHISVVFLFMYWPPIWLKGKVNQSIKTLAAHTQCLGNEGWEDVGSCQEVKGHSGTVARLAGVKGFPPTSCYPPAVDIKSLNLRQMPEEIEMRGKKECATDRSANHIHP